MTTKIQRQIPQKFPHLLSDQPVKSTWPKKVDGIVNSVALRKFAEISFALSVNFLLAKVTANLTLTLCVLFLGTAIVLKIGNLASECFQIKKEKNEEEDPLDWGQKFARFSFVNLMMQAGPSILVHESGHAVAAKLLFKNAQPIISIVPFKGGSTSFITSYGLKSLGEKLGKSTSKLIIAASGIMASTIFASLSFVLAERVKDSHPNASQWLEWQGISQLAGDILYGATAFVADKTKMSHDFINLWVKGGINPLVPIGLIICIPIICKLAAAHFFKKDSLTAKPLKVLQKELLAS